MSHMGVSDQQKCDGYTSWYSRPGGQVGGSTYRTRWYNRGLVCVRSGHSPDVEVCLNLSSHSKQHCVSDLALNSPASRGKNVLLK